MARSRSSKSGGSKIADAAIEKSKEVLKPKPMPPPKKGGKPKRIVSDKY